MEWTGKGSLKDDFWDETWVTTSSQPYTDPRRRNSSKKGKTASETRVQSQVQDEVRRQGPGHVQSLDHCEIFAFYCKHNGSCPRRMWSSRGHVQTAFLTFLRHFYIYHFIKIFFLLLHSRLFKSLCFKTFYLKVIISYVLQLRILGLKVE